MVSYRCFINLGGTPLLGAQAAGEVAKMIHRQRQVGVQRFADRFPVVPALRHRQIFQMLFNTIGDLQQQPGALLHCGCAPRRRRSVGGVEGEVNASGIRPGKLRNVAAVYRGGIHKEFTAQRLDKFTVNKVAVSGFK